MAAPAVPVQHIVLFRFPQALTAADIATMRRQIAAWVGAIPGLTRVRFGEDVSGRSQGHQVGLLTEFDSADALQAYFPHPLHQVFARWVADRGGAVLALDYPLTALSSLLEPASG